MKLSLDILKDEKAPAIALLGVALRQYGTECFDWHPAILRVELEDDYNISLSDLQSDKLQAAITILTSNAFEDQWEVFTTCCHLLCNVHYEFTDFTPLEAEYIAMALPEVYLIKDNDVETFSDEVRAFAGNAFHEYGMFCSPEIFPDALMPVCDEAGKIEQSEKSEALTELFNTRKESIETYFSNLN